SPIDLLLGFSTVEEADVRHCRKIGPPQAVAYCGGYRPDFRGAPRGLRPGAASAAGAATGRLSGPASAASGSNSGCPRLTDGAARGTGPDSHGLHVGSFAVAD